MLKLAGSSTARSELHQGSTGALLLRSQLETCWVERSHSLCPLVPLVLGLGHSVDADASVPDLRPDRGLGEMPRQGRDLDQPGLVEIIALPRSATCQSRGDSKGGVRVKPGCAKTHHVPVCLGTLLLRSATLAGAKVRSTKEASGVASLA